MIHIYPHCTIRSRYSTFCFYYIILHQTSLKYSIMQRAALHNEQYLYNMKSVKYLVKSRDSRDRIAQLRAPRCVARALGGTVDQTPD